MLLIMRITFNIFAIISIFLISVSCNKQEDTQSLQIDIVKQLACDSLRSTEIIPSEYTIQKDSILFVYAQDTKNNISMQFRINADTLLIIDSVFPNIQHMFLEMCISDKDSIFVFPEARNTLLLKNKNGDILAKQEVPSKYCPIAWNTLCIKDNSILVANAGMSALTTEDRLLMYDQIKPILKVTLTAEGSLKCVNYGRYPDIYRKTGNDYHDYYPQLAFVSNKKTCSAFEADHYIYLYNDTILEAKKKAKSRFIHHLNTIADKDKYDMVNLKNYLLNEPRYIDLVYDKFYNRFYRIVLHRRFFDEKLKKYQRKASVMMFDKELNFLGEEYLPKGIVFKMFVPTPWGILTKQTAGNQDNKACFCFIKIRNNTTKD